LKEELSELQARLEIAIARGHIQLLYLSFIRPVSRAHAIVTSTTPSCAYDGRAS
jgi:hypothetical protein